MLDDKWSQKHCTIKDDTFRGEASAPAAHFAYGWPTQRYCRSAIPAVAHGTSPRCAARHADNVPKWSGPSAVHPRGSCALRSSGMRH